MTDDAPKIQIDSDWKAQAQAEKEQLAEQERQKAAEAEAQGGGQEGEAPKLPPANWETLVGMMATQAVMYLGGYVDPETNRAVVDLEMARHQIDLLGVLVEKTKGNLSEEESKNLESIVNELRMRFVQIVEMARAQAAQGGGMPGGIPGIGGIGGEGMAPGAGAAGGIVTPPGL